MTNDTLSVAQHYFDIGQYQKAFDELSKSEFSIDNLAHLEHNLLLSDILQRLGKFEEGRELLEHMCSKYPENYDCISAWLAFVAIHPHYAKQAYTTAEKMLSQYPDDYWLWLMLSDLAFHFRLKKRPEVLALIEKTLYFSREPQVLRLAITIFNDAKRFDDAKGCLDELIEFEPDSLTNQFLLIKYLKRKKRYQEMALVSGNVLRNYPDNEDIKKHYEYASNALKQGSLKWMLNFSEDIVEFFDISRSSASKPYRFIQLVFFAIGTILSISFLIIAPLIYVFLAMFFLHYVLFRSLNDQSKLDNDDSPQLDFEERDQVNHFNDVTTIYLADKYSSKRFLYINHEQMVLAKDAHCMLEDLHFDFTSDDLIKAESIGHTNIKDIEIEKGSVKIKADKFKIYTMDMYNESTLTFIQEKLLAHGYKFIREEKKSFSVSLVLSGIFGLIAYFASLFIANFSSTTAFVLQIAIVTNVVSYLLYQLVAQTKVSIYQYSGTPPNDTFHNSKCTND